MLDLHHEAFFSAKPYADKTKHPVPCDTRAWSQILVSILTGIPGLERKKGTDLADGSDVKAANVWSAIDTPRFNGAIPSGRTSEAARRPDDVSALDGTPYIFLVLWDEQGKGKAPRCRVWCVRANDDPVFRATCAEWYRRRANGSIRSTNFQLHPPRNLDHNVIRNECGNLSYPLLFCAVREGDGFVCMTYDPSVMQSGTCIKV